MGIFLGLDTSNYTTSAAVYNAETGRVVQEKRLLAVKDGALGLRQSDAVFSHVKQLGGIVEALLEKAGGAALSGIGASTRPRDVEGSYMPCFLVGEMVAQTLSAVLRLPLSRVSHQAGHIAAALYSAGRLSLVGEPFAAFHLSGGTTECLLVRPDRGRVFSVELAARSLDLKAGQAVDRVGGMLGLPFPAGRELEALALESRERYRPRIPFHGADCSLSGLENQCARLLEQGAPRCDVARFCIDGILAAVDQMTAWLRKTHGGLPVVYSGGVMSNAIIREEITKKYGGSFAEPQFSSDNAAGVAVLAALMQTGGGQG